MASLSRVGGVSIVAGVIIVGGVSIVAGVSIVGVVSIVGGVSIVSGGVAADFKLISVATRWVGHSIGTDDEMPDTGRDQIIGAGV